MLVVNILAQNADLTVKDVRCRRPCSSWESESADENSIVFVRDGFFRRRVRGIETLVDSTAVYFQRRGEEHDFAHPSDGDDVSTSVTLSDDLLASLGGGEPVLPDATVFSTPQLDLAHRRLVAACAQRSAFHVADAVVSLAAAAIGSADPARVTSGRPTTAARRREIVQDARELLRH